MYALKNAIFHFYLLVMSSYVHLRNFVFSSVTQSCPTHCDPLDSSLHQAPLPMGFSRQEHWSGLPFPSPGNKFHKSPKRSSILKSITSFYLAIKNWKLTFWNDTTVKNIKSLLLRNCHSLEVPKETWKLIKSAILNTSQNRKTILGRN